MKNNSKTPHMGMIVALGVLIAAIWMLAIYDTIQDAHEEKYDVSVRPGAVSYGIHSSAMIPMVSAPSHTSAPMISGSAIRSYAHYGHAAYTVHHTPYTVHTTSSATVQTIGSGNGGGTSSSPAGGKGGSRGIAYGGGSVSMPSFALATPAYATTPTNMEEAVQQGAKPRRMPGSPGTWEGQTSSDSEGLWVWDGEGWTLSIPDGTTKVEGGQTYVYHDGWQLLEDQGDPGVTLGDTPWHWMLLLALGYGIAKIIRPKHNTI